MSKLIKARLMTMSKQELFKLRDAIKIVSIYVDLLSLTEIQKEIADRLEELKEKGG